jgi:hypothetical protein
LGPYIFWPPLSCSAEKGQKGPAFSRGSIYSVAASRQFANGFCILLLVSCSCLLTDPFNLGGARCVFSQPCRLTSRSHRLLDQEDPRRGPPLLGVGYHSDGSFCDSARRLGTLLAHVAPAGALAAAHFKAFKTLKTYWHAFYVISESPGCWTVQAEEIKLPECQAPEEIWLLKPRQCSNASEETRGRPPAVGFRSCSGAPFACRT